MQWIGRLIDGLVLGALAWYVLAGVGDVPFHGDESTLIYMSRDYYYLVQQHDLDTVLYTGTPVNGSEQELRLLNGTIGKMAMGLAWDLSGYTVNDVNDPWAWGLNWDINAAMQHIPSRGVLLAARRSSALLTVISAWAVFAIGWLVMRGHSVAAARATAWASSLIYVTTPSVLLNGRRAMMEGSTLCFIALTVLAALLLIRAQARIPQRRAALWGWTVALGLMAGGAVASKHSAVLVIIPAFLAVALEPLVRRIESGSLAGGSLLARGWGMIRQRITLPHLIRLAVAGALVIVTFLVLNPAWWSDLPGMPDRVLTMRRDLLETQTDSYGGYESASARTTGLINALFFAGPQYYESSDWDEFSVAQAEIDAYDGSWVAGRSRGLVLWGALLVAAFAFGIVDLRDHWRDSAAWLALVWAGFVILALLAATPLEWQRYYLPGQSAVAVVCGVGVWRIGVSARLLLRGMQWRKAV